MNILLLYNVPEAPRAGGFGWTESEAGVLQAVRHVAEALRELDWPFRQAGIERLTELPGVIGAGNEEVVINLVERLQGGSNDGNYVPALCQALGRACTGGDSDCLLLTLDKESAKTRLRAHGVRVPEGLALPPGMPLPGAAALPAPPLFVKPLASDGSEGVLPGALVRDPATQLAAAVAAVHRTCGQPALVERYIEGRELNLAVMGVGDEPLPLPIAEIDFSLFPPGRAHVVDYDLKWHPGTLEGHVSPRKIPAALRPAQESALRRLASTVWRACGCRDYARIDCRMDSAGDVYVLEVNVNCDLSPLAGFANALRVAEIPFARFVAQLAENARRRAAVPQPG